MNDDIAKKIIAKIEAILKKKEFLDVIGKDIVFTYKATTRSGKNVNDEKFKYKNKKKRAEQKKKIAENNPTHKTFRPNTANLSITGQLVDGITYKIEAKNSTIVITAEGDHKPYKDKNGNDIGKTIKNKTLFKYLEEKGFTVFVSSEKLEQKIQKKIKEELRRKLKNKIQ